MGLRQIQVLAISLALIGCSTKKPEVPAVAQAPIAASDNFADKQDTAIERAAGYVAVAAAENKKAPPNSEPAKTVGVLLEAAGSYLDKPNQKNIDHAVALAGDHSRLTKVKEQAEKTIKDINDAWSKVVADAERRRVEAERNLAAKQMELDAAAKREQDLILALLGAGLIAAGALALIFGHWIGIGKAGALALMASGAGVAALPRLFDRKEFIWVALGLCVVTAAQIGWFLYRKLFPKIDKPPASTEG
jgi:hypothetical protein